MSNGECQHRIGVRALSVTHCLPSRLSTDSKGDRSLAGLSSHNIFCETTFYWFLKRGNEIKSELTRVIELIEQCMTRLEAVESADPSIHRFVDPQTQFTLRLVRWALTSIDSDVFSSMCSLLISSLSPHSHRYCRWQTKPVKSYVEQCIRVVAFRANR